MTRPKRYLTPRKRAEGKGAAHVGTEHHWSMMVSAVGLAFLVPVWLIIVGKALGSSRADVLDTFSQPFPAILTGLVLIVGLRHFVMGAQMMSEDYFRGTRRKLALIGGVAFGWTVSAIGLYALVKIAL
ncbi:succinate dehydrogenase, hydrophobic membrane anchor protein [Pseudogemmobacter blasticus]|uniref:Succinate dehydrogenase n=1 Tax=Fuscovulum blasticum DSM 2131 TaxID=1188250 RepID=A0A2T4J4G3_FUSBL|nr:succinate dehydrogenase, hydrophobic membrane anchor protein [Fuscovulum blasticum]AWD21553.1 succinate dehydrogenase [Fuscovulum blasticum]PTE12796.1 succinate dehydrogenase [Fuscovulum blasticum DSM 2131]